MAVRANIVALRCSRRGRGLRSPVIMRLVRASLAIALVLLTLTIVGFGRSDPLKDPSLAATQGSVGKDEANQWNVYSAAQQAHYRRAFALCSGWADVNSPIYDASATKAADYVREHEDSRGVRDARGYACADGSAGLPEAGSGIPVPP